MIPSDELSVRERRLILGTWIATRLVKLDTEGEKDFTLSSGISIAASCNVIRTE